MAVIREADPQHIVLHNISWQSYETILRELGENRVRVTYDDGDLEIRP